MAESSRQTASRHDAVHRIHNAHSIALDLPVLGRVKLPRPEQLAFYATLGVLAAAEIIDWPVALVVAAGHLLVHDEHNRIAQEIGEALEDA